MQDAGVPSVFDCVILGSGLVGSVMALLLQPSGMRVAVIEKNILSQEQSPTTTTSTDGRTTAVSFGSSLILKQAGVWEHLLPHIYPIEEIRVFESGTPFALNFLEEDKHTIPHNGPLGYMIDNGILREVLQNHLIHSHVAEIFEGCEVSTFTQTPAFTELSLSNGQEIKTKLVLSCEGRNAPSRAHFGIIPREFDYDQTALVGTITHEKPHEGVAFEVFHPRGPMAFLPLPSHEGEPHKSALVWSSKRDLKSLDDSEILKNLHQYFPHLGELYDIRGKQFYPLKGLRVSSIFAPRYLLLGDAAHVLHPVAGQGVNLGWKDASTLREVLCRSFSLGADIGSDMVIAPYARSRLLDQRRLFAVSDGMIRLFGMDNGFFKMMRSYGLGIVNRLPPLKRALMKHAMGR